MQTHRFSTWTLPAGLALAMLLACGPGVSRADIYMHEGRDGVPMFTDQRDMGPDYTFVRRYGRPTARHACQGLTRAMLDQRAADQMGWVMHYARHHRVDQELIRAIITVESCFDRFAVSRVGAEGLMQLMPGTAREVGVDNTFDPQQNIRGGVTYFTRMLDRFEGDLTLALAAYNAGPGAVERYGGVPPFRETQGYIERVFNEYRLLGGQP
ncbi:lytic transglycosylase domain-containing protein [Ectothiorhodospira marina]|jgi:soluble lytic murein transglycosylase-like protein|uniref:Transglycosylase SLT domain-containing protein n=1 Tax=Ectothiorhodospira marina TaxID=1396821 RepID=A0A1H7RE78_9GAMM|nr:lytic transglycosylase domain-containing protein [Ectothiorhodospira marina]SEL58541.1 Transglycosylase SLT domain-containing protein [Ectothiorhodospira marina]